MKVELLDAKSVGRNLKKLMAEYNDFYWSVAWMTENPLLRDLIAHKKKIKKFVVGIDFVQTSPEALEKVSEIKAARIATGNNGTTFHPKVYLFKSEQQYAAIVGSSNFTLGGLENNDEACLLLKGNTDEAVFTSLESMVNDWWDLGSEITPEFLSAYTLRWKVSKRSREDLGREFKIRKPTQNASHPELQQWSWMHYLEALRGADSPHIEDRLELLKRARELFANTESFANMNELERKAIAGIIGKRESNEDFMFQGLECGWFGSMKGAGVFKSRIKENDIHISLALEHIPMSGDVTKEDYLAFAGEYQEAFSNAPRTGGIPTASRLLAMKRPDCFVCVDDKNLRGLAADLGFKQSHLDLETYWDLVVLPIIESNWWNARRPAGLNGKIWDSRAAMLDVIYYDWS